MSEVYDNIENFGTGIYEWYKSVLPKERLLYSELIELFLEPIKSIGGHSKDVDYGQMALLILSTRLFNDAEAVNLLLLRGLPCQAEIVIRDIIECSMLFRLFLINPKFAKNWIMKSNEYSAGAVNAILKESKINAREYAFYGSLSHMAHASLLASLSATQEKENAEGMLRTYHFGSSRTPETIYFVEQHFLMLFFLLHRFLIEPLAEFYYIHSNEDDYNLWANKVHDLIPKLIEITEEVNKRKQKDESQLDPQIFKMVEKRMRMKEVKNTLSGNGD